ncbi:hypothetical protein BaRGS_00007907 [Batillaria attramentaria]|uniref:Uncharacterized protein n=1 Tax=Batillaria attramentaria TaxID=370345 RepID=A0ABD0LPM7_9CAEN
MRQQPKKKKKTESTECRKVSNHKLDCCSEAKKKPTNLTIHALRIEVGIPAGCIRVLCEAMRVGLRLSPPVDTWASNHAMDVAKECGAYCRLSSRYLPPISSHVCSAEPQRGPLSPTISLNRGLLVCLSLKR